MVNMMKLFECVCKENEIWGHITEQIFLGQINPIKMIDFTGEQFKPKISAIIIEKSGSGKDQMIDVLLRISKEFELKIDNVMEINEAGLTGTVRRNEIEYGKLKDYNILAFPECSNLFINSEHKLTLVTTLQGALEKKGYVNKTVYGKDIKYETDVSVLMVSVPFKKAKEVVMDKGIFQRCVVSFGNKKFDDISAILYDTIIPENKVETELRKYVDNIKQALQSYPGTIQLDLKLATKYRKEIEMFFREERKEITDEYKRGVFDGYLIRAVFNMERMAVNIMFRDMKKELDDECYEVPVKIIKHHIVSMKRMFNETYIKKKFKPGVGNKKPYNKERVKAIIDEHDGTKEKLVEKIMKETKTSRVTAFKIIEEVK